MADVFPAGNALCRLGAGEPCRGPGQPWAGQQRPSCNPGLFDARHSDPGRVYSGSRLMAPWLASGSAKSGSHDRGRPLMHSDHVTLLLASWIQPLADGIM
jgi:hypothetical protein